jgi:hypothetical protein
MKTLIITVGLMCAASVAQATAVGRIYTCKTSNGVPRVEVTYSAANMAGTVFNVEIKKVSANRSVRTPLKGYLRLMRNPKESRRILDLAGENESGEHPIARLTIVPALHSPSLGRLTYLETGKRFSLNICTKD